MTSQAPPPEARQSAPDFTLVGNSRDTFTLRQFRGKKVVLAFYVLDFTGG